MGDCDYPYLAPGGQRCGAGDCVNPINETEFCSCFEGFAATGDFHFEPLDCDQHLPSLRGLWSLTAIANFIAFLIGISYTIPYLKAKRKQKNVTPIFLGYTLSAALLCTIGVFKSIDPSERLVGKDEMLTVFFCISGWTWWTCGFAFTRIFARFYYLQAQSYGAKLNFIYIMPFRTLILLNSIAFVAPFVCLFDQRNAVVYQIIHYATCAVMIIVSGVHFMRFFARKLIESLDFALRQVDNALTKSTENKDSMKKLRDTMKFYQNLNIQNVVFNTILALGVCFWPFLTRKASYALAVAWMSSGINTFAAFRVLGGKVNKITSTQSESSSGPVANKTMP